MPLKPIGHTCVVSYSTPMDNDDGLPGIVHIVWEVIGHELNSKGELREVYRPNRVKYRNHDEPARPAARVGPQELK